MSVWLQQRKLSRDSAPGGIDLLAASPRCGQPSCCERDQERPFRLGGAGSHPGAPARVV